MIWFLSMGFAFTMGFVFDLWWVFAFVWMVPMMFDRRHDHWWRDEQDIYGELFGEKSKNTPSLYSQQETATTTDDLAEDAMLDMRGGRRIVRLADGEFVTVVEDPNSGIFIADDANSKNDTHFTL